MLIYLKKTLLLLQCFEFSLPLCFFTLYNEYSLYRWTNNKISLFILAKYLMENCDARKTKIRYFISFDTPVVCRDMCLCPNWYWGFRENSERTVELCRVRTVVRVRRPGPRETLNRELFSITSLRVETKLLSCKS